MSDPSDSCRIECWKVPWGILVPIRMRAFPILLALLSFWNLPAFAGATVEVEVKGVSAAAAADVVVYALPLDRKIPPGGGTAVMDQKDRAFVPHVLVVQRGTKVNFPNSDEISHHVYSFSPAKRFQLPLYKGNAPDPVVFDTAGVVALGCNIHDRMSAYIIVVETPHFAKSDASGSAVLRDLDPGTYALHVWYPEMRSEAEPARITVMVGNSRLQFSFVTGSRAFTPVPQTRPVE